MNKLTFFHNRRKDGGVRNGIVVNGEMLLHSYTESVAEHDPVLLWFIDLRFELNSSNIETGDGAREFLLGIADVAQRALFNCAGELRAGLDMDCWPAQRVISGLAPDVQGTVFFSAMQRLTHGELANAFQDLAQNWERILRALEPALEVV